MHPQGFVTTGTKVVGMAGCLFLFRDRSRRSARLLLRMALRAVGDQKRGQAHENQSPPPSSAGPRQGS